MHTLRMHTHTLWRLLFHASNAPQPGLVEGRSHVDAGQVGGGTPDTVGHGTDQLVPSVGTLQHQWTTAVTLQGEKGEKKGKGGI